MKLTSIKMLRSLCREEGDCLLWDQSCAGGHPSARIDGKSTLLRGYVFTKLLGKKVPEGQVIAPVCGNKLCLSETCLRAMPHGDAMRLRFEATGGRIDSPATYQRRVKGRVAIGRTKMDFAKVERIRTQQMNELDTVLAKEYGVSLRTIANIKHRRTWRTPPATGVSAFTWSGS